MVSVVNLKCLPAPLYRGPYVECCWGWHIYSCFRMTGRQSDMSYCLWDASCLSSIPWTRRRELHNWRTNIPTSCSWVVIMTDLLTWLSISVTLELVLAGLIWTFWLRILPNNSSLRDPCEVCRTVVGTQFLVLQSTMKWTWTAERIHGGFLMPHQDRIKLATSHFPGWNKNYQLYLHFRR